MDHNYYSNEDLKNGIYSIARQMTLDNWRPSLIVGVLRGGIVPAVYLSHWYECPMLAIEWSTRDNAVGQSLEDLRIIKELIKGNSVLLVDDICDSGLTLKEIEDVLKEQYNKSKSKKKKIFDLKVACLHYNIAQDLFDPNYYHLEINKNDDPRWIVYEWERN